MAKAIEQSVSERKRMEIISEEDFWSAWPCRELVYRARIGQFVYTWLFAFEGAYAVVSPVYDGTYVSNEFPLFDSPADCLDPNFLRRYVSQRQVYIDAHEYDTPCGAMAHRNLRSKGL